MLDHHKIYSIMFRRYGDLGWWPAETRDEILIGTILTQNTTWTNVTKCISALKGEQFLTIKEIAKLDQTRLEELIRSSGYFRQKALRLKTICARIISDLGGIESMDNMSTEDISEYFSNLNGIGRETLDSILLYVFNRPVFVIDAYTLRILERVYGSKIHPDKIRSDVVHDLKSSTTDLKNYHATFVETGKNYCRKQPKCVECPLYSECNYAIDLSSP